MVMTAFRWHANCFASTAVFQAGMTPLLLAARFSSTEVIRCLLLAGADIGACTEVKIHCYDGLNSAGD
jgi:Ankyrin repeat